MSNRSKWIIKSNACCNVYAHFHFTFLSSLLMVPHMIEKNPQLDGSNIYICSNCSFRLWWVHFIVDFHSLLTLKCHHSAYERCDWDQVCLRSRAETHSALWILPINRDNKDVRTFLPIADSEADIWAGKSPTNFKQ